MKRFPIASFAALVILILSAATGRAQTPGWSYYQCSMISGVTLTTSYQQIASCIDPAQSSWPISSASFMIYPIGILDVSITYTSAGDINMELSAGGTGCAHSSTAVTDYFKFLPNRRQLWHVGEGLFLSGGPALFPAGCNIDLYAKTSTPLHPPTLNVGSGSATNIIMVVANQPVM